MMQPLRCDAGLLPLRLNLRIHRNSNGLVCRHKLHSSARVTWCKGIERGVASQTRHSEAQNGAHEAPAAANADSCLCVRPQCVRTCNGVWL